LAKAASRPAAVTGPRDLAPLAREAAIFSREFIWVFVFVIIWRKTERSALCAFRLSRKTERSALCANSRPKRPMPFWSLFFASFMRSFPSSFSQTFGAFSVRGRDK
jgi:hypothetical protein